MSLKYFFTKWFHVKYFDDQNHSICNLNYLVQHWCRSLLRSLTNVYNALLNIINNTFFFFFQGMSHFPSFFMNESSCKYCVFVHQETYQMGIWVHSVACVTLENSSNPNKSFSCVAGAAY